MAGRWVPAFTPVVACRSVIGRPCCGAACMYLIALPDLHGDTRALPLLADEFARADAVLLVGDLTTGGPADPAQRIVETIRQWTPRLFAVCGNWDTSATASYLSTQGINLEGTPRWLDEVLLLGLGGALPSGVPTPNEVSEATLATHLAAMRASIAPGQSLILVTHQPPINTHCDRTSLGTHVGSWAVRRFLEEVQPRVCVSGHIHEGIGVDQVGTTTVVNPGPLWMGQYATITWTDVEVQVQCRVLRQP